MSLIRNGGFERGDTEFWEVIGNGVLAIDNTNPLYGNYSAIVTATGSGDITLLSTDYIKIKPYQIIETLGYIKYINADWAFPVLYMYDSNYSYIGYLSGMWIKNNNTYVKMNSQFQIPSGCVYVRFGIRMYQPSTFEPFYIDGIALDYVNVDGGMSGVKQLLAMDAYNANGDTQENAQDLMQFSTYYAEVYCAIVGGTSPTLDITVKEINPVGDVSILGSFPTINAVGNYKLSLTNCVGKEVFIVYTLGGTDPVFDFKVGLVGKR